MTDTFDNAPDLTDFADPDPSNFILRQQRASLAYAANNIDSDPAKAARAIELSQATGDPASMISLNLDEYERQHKAMLTSELLKSNSYLRDYAAADPMNAKLSSDGWASLDAVSQSVQKLSLMKQGGEVLGGIAKGAIEGYQKGAVEGGGIGDWALLAPGAKDHPLYAAMQAVGWAPFEIGTRLLQGGIEGVTEAAHQGALVLAKQFGADDSTADRFAREIGAVAQTEVMGLSGRHPVHGPEPTEAPAAKPTTTTMTIKGHTFPMEEGEPSTAPTPEPEPFQAQGPLKKIQDMAEVSRPWLEDGKVPPPGLNPDIDKLLFEQNKTDVDNLNDALATAQADPTRERSPDVFASFIRQHSDASIGISGDAVARLYGDKVPESGDNILGFVPGLASELETARATGGDVHVPLADWLAKVDPEVAKELQDDIRVRPGGVTKAEVDAQGEARDALDATLPEDQKSAPATALPEPLPAVRGAAALEPMFSVGDRKLELKRAPVYHEGKTLSQTLAGAMGSDSFFHDFDLMDESGQKRGQLILSEQKEGKQLYVETIQGGGTSKMYDPNYFGPGLIRSLYRQIKEEFPDAFGPEGLGITGHRVTGAREKAGTYELKSAMPVVKRSVDTGEADFDTLIREGNWEHIGGGDEADFQPKESFTAKEQELFDAAHEELKRIAPGVTVTPVAGIREPSGSRKIRGAFIQYSDRPAEVLLRMDDPDKLSTARHEGGIHYLRRMGFFEGAEWPTLERAARDNGWVEKYNIEKNYPNESPGGKLEEAVAHAYPAWKKDPASVPTKVHPIFQKIADLIEAVKNRFKDILGMDRQPTWEDLFKKIDSGEIGGREGAEPLNPKAFREPRLSAEEGEAQPFDRAQAVGMTEDQFGRYMKLIAERHEADLAKALDRAKAEQSKRQTKEWKTNAAQVRSEVENSIRNRPDVAADLYFGTGELYGEKVAKPKLGTEYLTAEQRDRLPAEYVGKDGINPDDAAGQFGYHSGDMMVRALGDYNEAKLQAGMSAGDFVKRMSAIETERQMEARYGQLDKSILEDAQDQALSETQTNLLAEETYALGLRTGQSPITKDQMTAFAKEKMLDTPMSSISTEAGWQAMGKAGRAAENALLRKDFAGAFQEKQRQFMAMVFTKEAKKLEKAKAQLDKTAKTYGKAAEKIKTVDAEYLNHAQDILARIGYRVQRTQAHVAENIARRGAADVSEFINQKLVESNGLRDIPLADALNDPKFSKPVDDLTAFEFTGIKQTIDALLQNGRGEKKVYREGEAAELDELKADMVAKIRAEPARPQNLTKTRWDRAVDLPKSLWAGLTSVETMFHDLSGKDQRGVFNKWIIHPLFKAENGKSRMLREFSKPYRELGFEKADMGKLVEAPFADPNAPKGTNEPWPGFSRGNVLAMLQNMGNKSNLRVLTKGFNYEPEALKAWIAQHITHDDVRRAQALGDNLFKPLIDHADGVYERINGVTVDKIPLEPVTFQTKDGPITTPGWYHPLIRDPDRRGNIPERIGGYDDSDFGHITTNNGYTKKRTGAVYPLDLSFDSVPQRITQMIHDINMRETILETQKIFKDPQFLNALTYHYGAHYSQMLKPYLESIAGAESIPSRAMAKAIGVSNHIRQNVISTYIGFNPSTAMKHGPTALVLSMKQVGVRNFASAVKSLYGQSPELGLTNSEFAMKNSEELQRRERHWQDTFAGAQKVLQGETTARERVIQYGSMLVAKSDMMSAKPTWLAAYKEAKEEGSDHGEAVDLADQKVRFAHGTTAKVNQPGAVRGGGPLNSWLTSIYGFMGTIMQRKIETANAVNDMYHLGKGGQIKDAAKMIPGIVGDIMTYALWPVIVEEAVTSQYTDDRRGLLTHGAMMLSSSAVNSVLYLRDLFGMFQGRDASVGLASSPLEDTKKMIMDLEKGRGAFSKQRAGKTIGDTLTVIGHGTGMAPKTLDSAARFGIDLVNRQAHPKTAGDWWRGVTHGTTKLRVEK